MKHLIAIILIIAFVVPSFAETSKNQSSTTQNLKDQVYGLTQKVKMYKMEIESLRKQLAKKQVTIEKLNQSLASSTTNRSNRQGYSSSSIQNYAQREAIRQKYQQQGQKYQQQRQQQQNKKNYQRLIIGNNTKIKLYYKEKAKFQKKYKNAIKEQKGASLLIGKKRRRTESEKWDREVRSLKYKIENVDKKINLLKQQNARYMPYAK